MRKMNRMHKMMTGLISVAAAAALLAGCGSTAGGGAGAANTAKAANNANTANAADGAYNMAYVVSTEDEYLGLLRDQVVAAAEEKGVNMEVLYSGNDALKMIDCVEAAKSKGKDAVLINLLTA